MRFSTAVFVFLIFAATVTATAQKKTITNADLEKYRQARLAAERDYRENHVRLGMPSPEELDRRNEASRKELSELSSRLREEEMLERQQAGRSAHAAASVINLDLGTRVNGIQGIAPAVVWGYYGYGRDRRYRPAYRVPSGQQYYVSGGSIWPVGPRTPSRPLIRVKRR